MQQDVVWMGPYKSAGYYKNGNAVGIKDKKGRQVFSFGGKSSKLKEQQLREVGNQVIAKLNRRELDAGAAAAWAKQQC